MSTQDPSPTLASLLQDHFGDHPESERVEHVGQRAAEAWVLGSEGLRQAGFLLPPALYRQLEVRATGVRTGGVRGATFLSELRLALCFDDFLVAFVSSLATWLASRRRG